jgi:hypothetical protein
MKINRRITARSSGLVFSTIFDMKIHGKIRGGYAECTKSR